MYHSIQQCSENHILKSKYKKGKSHNMNEIQLDTCTKNILCVDCRDTTCLHAGKIMADCPKYKCDNDVLLDCEHCDLL